MGFHQIPVIKIFTFRESKGRKKKKSSRGILLMSLILPLTFFFPILPFVFDALYKYVCASAGELRDKFVMKAFLCLSFFL